MMAVLEQAIPLVRAPRSVELDLARFRPNDPGVTACCRPRTTVGVFQVERAQQMATLRACGRTTSTTSWWR